MKNLTFIIILILQPSFIYSQNEFQNAVKSLNHELGFKNTSNLTLLGRGPDDKFTDKFKNCSETEKLEKLQKLNFNSIRFSTATELQTYKWNHKYVIEFRELIFKCKKDASKFIRILNSLKKSQIQHCLNKEGIMWWKKKDRIYLVTSRNDFEINHYKEIKQAILNGMKK